MSESRNTVQILARKLLLSFIVKFVNTINPAKSIFDCLNDSNLWISAEAIHNDRAAKQIRYGSEGKAELGYHIGNNELKQVG